MLKPHGIPARDRCNMQAAPKAPLSRRSQGRRGPHERVAGREPLIEHLLLGEPCRCRSGDRSGDRARAGPPARRDRAHRLREHRLPRGPRGSRLRDDQQIRGGLSQAPLLRRLPVRRHGRGTRDRARHPPVRLPLRQRAAELGLAGQPGRVHGLDEAGRHLHGASTSPAGVI